jgi:hypothetical protein
MLIQAEAEREEILNNRNFQRVGYISGKSPVTWSMDIPLQDITLYDTAYSID